MRADLGELEPGEPSLAELRILLGRRRDLLVDRNRTPYIHRNRGDRMWERTTVKYLTEVDGARRSPGASTVPMIRWFRWATDHVFAAVLTLTPETAPHL